MQGKQYQPNTWMASEIRESLEKYASDGETEYTTGISVEMRVG